MKNVLLILFAGFTMIMAGCQKEEQLGPADAIYLKFINKTGESIEGLLVSRADIGDLSKGKSTDYMRYETFGQQFKYMLTEAVGTMGGKRYFQSSACSGVCGTPSAPYGVWLENGYYKVVVTRSPELGGNYLDFRLAE
ncbi:MAG: hypothetical protein R2830_26220 [Saprospiraceae bacterium]